MANEAEKLENLSINDKQQQDGKKTVKKDKKAKKQAEGSGLPLEVRTRRNLNRQSDAAVDEPAARVHSTSYRHV